MKLTTIVEVRQDGGSGKSVLSTRVREDYSEQRLAARVNGQFAAAKEELDADLAERRRARAAQMGLFDALCLTREAPLTGDARAGSPNF